MHPWHVFRETRRCFTDHSYVLVIPRRYILKSTWVSNKPPRKRHFVCSDDPRSPHGPVVGHKQSNDGVILQTYIGNRPNTIYGAFWKLLGKERKLITLHIEWEKQLVCNRNWTPPYIIWYKIWKRETSVTKNTNDSGRYISLGSDVRFVSFLVDLRVFLVPFCPSFHCFRIITRRSTELFHA